MIDNIVLIEPPPGLVRYKMAARPVIFSEKCNGCGLCVEVCNKDALVMEDGKVTFTGPVECDYCGECETICPNEAINCYYDIVLGE